MTHSLLKDIDEALRDAVVSQHPPVPTVAQMVNATGLHPIADGRTTRARHARPWCAAMVYLDAKDALDNVQVTGRRVDRSFIGGAMSLLAREVDAAEWTLGAVGPR